MSLGHESTDFEWLDPELHSSQLTQESDATPASEFLKEGYLHVMERLPSKDDDSSTALARMAMKLVRRMSDPSILGNWNRRWCVLSRTAQGIHLLLYKDQSSFSNLQSPCGVLALESCLRLSSLPAHNKSENAFTLALDKREFLFYTDKRSEFEEWLQILEDGLNLQDAYCHSPLKGLPRQKALRKDQQGSLSEDLETISPGVVKSAVGGDNGHSDIIATAVLKSTSQAPSLERIAPEQRDGRVTVRRTVSLRKHTPQAMEQEEPVRFVNFKKLNT